MTQTIETISWLGYRLRLLRYKFIRHVLKRTHVVARTRYFGLQFRALTQDRHGQRLSKYGTHEDHLTLALLDAAKTREGSLMLDIGANLGWYSCVFAKAIPALQVHAFEPDPVTYALLGENIALNDLGNIRPVQAAVSSTRGSAEFFQYQGGNRGMNSLLPMHAAQSTSVTVPTLVLDEYLAENGLGDVTIRVIKLDIEGYELEALRGAPAALQRCQCLLMEYSPKFFRQFGYEGDALLDPLYAAGLQPHVIRAGILAAASRDELLAEPSQINTIWLR